MLKIVKVLIQLSHSAGLPNVNKTLALLQFICGPWYLTEWSGQHCDFQLVHVTSDDDDDDDHNHDHDHDDGGGYDDDDDVAADVAVADDDVADDADDDSVLALVC